MTAAILSAAHLRSLHCTHAIEGVNAHEASRLCHLLDGWNVEIGTLVKAYAFADYYQTMAFVNALAYISHKEDHHPELVVGYKSCQVRYDTHSVGGLSLNDFICAAKADALA